MPTVFESISDGFYTAFFEPDQDKRKNKLESWIKKSTPVIQSAVEDELMAYLKEVLEGTWEEKGWVYRAKKFYGEYHKSVQKQGDIPIPFIDAYQLNLQLKILHGSSKKNCTIIDDITPEVRAKTNEAIEKAKTIIKTMEPPINPQTITTSSIKALADEEEDDTDNFDDSSRSPNDDRSDSMNPNNDSYQTSMDNRSDQMNPNNDAYRSSRGR